MQQQGYTDPAKAIAEGSVRAILASNDIVECPIEPDRLSAVVTTLTTAIQSGRISREGDCISLGIPVAFVALYSPF